MLNEPVGGFSPFILGNYFAEFFFNLIMVRYSNPEVDTLLEQGRLTLFCLRKSERRYTAGFKR
jgi:hypothetical protein